MAEELSEQIKAIEAEIAEVKERLNRTFARLEAVRELPADQREGLLPDLRAERDLLGKELEQLRKELEQLRTKENLLLNASMQRGAARCFSAGLLGLVLHGVTPCCGASSRCEGGGLSQQNAQPRSSK